MGSHRHAWTTPNVLRIGVTQVPYTLNPLLGTQTVENLLFGLAFDPLIAYDPQGNAVPRLARTVPTVKNGGISKDGLTITYHMRKNLRWQDGAPLTSRDVAYTYRQIMNPNNNVAVRTGYDVVNRVDTPDAYTVVFHLKRRFSPIVSDLFAQGVAPPGYVVPEHLLAKYASLNRIDFNAQPIGSGPFKVVAWRRGDSIEYVANPNYYLGKPKIARIIVRLIPDENSAVTALQSHEIDVMYNVSPATYPRVQALQPAGITTLLAPLNRWNGLVVNTSRAPLSDVRVRQAIAYAVDKAALVHNVLHDTATVATGDIPDFLWAYYSKVPRYGYNPQRARALLQSAGWSLARPLHVLLVFNEADGMHRGFAVQLQSELAQIGIQADLKGYPAEMLYASYAAGGIIDSGKFDLALEGVSNGADPDEGYQIRCTAIPPNGWNDPRYCNREMDAAQDAAVSTFDLTERKKAYARIETILVHDAPYIYIAWTKAIHGVNSDLHGFSPSVTGATWNAYQWSI
jgi:peptide/nickel transport system substrate-binding protein